MRTLATPTRLAIAAVALCASIGCSSTHRSSASTTSTSSTVATTTTAMSDVAKLKEWGRQNRDTVQGLSTAITDLTSANASGNSTTLTTACYQLSRAVISGQSSPPIPVSVYQTHWQLALQLLAQAGNECTDAASNHDLAKGTDAARLVSQGTDQLAQATATAMS